MAILMFKKILQKSQKPFFSLKLFHQWSIGLLVLLTRIFFPTGSGGFKMAGTDKLKDIKNSRPNWPGGQFSKTNITTTLFKWGFSPFTEFLGELTKYPGAKIIVSHFFYCVLNSTKTISCKKVLKSLLSWSFYFGLI